MTLRKPLGTTFEPWIESQIRAAMEEGAFDNLPGAGKPLATGQGLDPEWWVKQLIAREKVSMLPSTPRSPRPTPPWSRGRRQTSRRWTSTRS
jgi:hypothetical protein